MNRKTITGHFQVALGKVQERFASMTGNAELQRQALQRQSEGKIMHAVGEAQELIQRSLRSGVRQ
ncbi:CsbD family protein [Herbaspirillum sp.]|uniref:CsbD family protein n=1 Tax=Herbaspirillum sp. TaxID=1890675 RepID=UPI001B1783E2|nr:CsbD family protein [Herbaspirillum sp.]MBO9538677.1 CsbD family protein [Herbaspirillum sp.]